MCTKTWLSWSSGKDSGWALHELRLSDVRDVAGLCTAMNTVFDRAAMHAVRLEPLRKQARATALSLPIAGCVELGIGPHLHL